MAGNKVVFLIGEIVSRWMYGDESFQFDLLIQNNIYNNTINTVSPCIYCNIFYYDSLNFYLRAFTQIAPIKTITTVVMIQNNLSIMESL